MNRLDNFRDMSNFPGIHLCVSEQWDGVGSSGYDYKLDKKDPVGHTGNFSLIPY